MRPVRLLGYFCSPLRQITHQTHPTTARHRHLTRKRCIRMLPAVAHNPVRPARTYLLSARCSVLASNSDRHALVVPSVESSQLNHPLTSRGSSATTCDIRRTARMTGSSTPFALVAGLATIFYTGWYGCLDPKMPAYDLSMVASNYMEIRSGSAELLVSGWHLRAVCV